MAGADAEVSKSKFSKETCEQIGLWLADTQVEFGPNRKVQGSKSYDRYENYSKARTIAEVLELGAKPDDLLHDFDRYLFKIVGGPLREAPLDKDNVEDGTPISDLDILIARLAAKCNPAAGGAVAVGRQRQQAHQGGKRAHEGEPTQGKPEAGHGKKLSIHRFAQAHKAKSDQRKTEEQEEKVLRSINAKREAADRLAADILKAAGESKRRITDREISEVLRRWVFHKSETRQNVLPKGATWVYSDTLGLVSLRTGAYVTSSLATQFPNLPRVLNQWLKDHRPSEFSEDFPFTTISLNSDYAARLHRDGNNAGPSMIRAFGRFKGGQLGYWPDDDKSGPLEKLQAKDRVTFDISKGLVLFDGNRGHEVDDFDGERFSVVWFTSKGYGKLQPSVRDALVERGFVLPSEATLAPFWSRLPKPRGYESQALDKFFVGKTEQPPTRTYQWFDMSNPEEDKVAAQLLKTLLPAEEPKTGGLGALFAASAQQQASSQASAQQQQRRPAAPRPAGASPKPRQDAPSPKSGIKQPRPRPAADEDESARDDAKRRRGPRHGRPGKQLQDGLVGLAGADAGLGMMSDGLKMMLRAAKSSDFGADLVVEQIRPQLMEHMQEVLRFAASQ